MRTDEITVETFVAHLRDHGHDGLTVDRRPDQEKPNRNTREIDAVAGPFAIEHTSIDTIDNQRTTDAWFTTVAAPLEQRFRDGLGCRLRVRVPYDAIRPGHDWTAIGSAIQTWIESSAPTLADGDHAVTLPAVPFELRVEKQSAAIPGLFFRRSDPGDTTLADRVRELLTEKAGKLQPYRRENLTTVLLVESSDIALMNGAKMLTAIRDAFGGLPDGVDQVWYADSSCAPIEFWDLTMELRARDRA